MPNDSVPLNGVVGECPVCANDGSYCSNPKCPMDPDNSVGFTLDVIVGRHDLCGGRLYLQDHGTTYCYKCDAVVEELCP